ncbi:MAG: hypothetical protein CO170_01570 [candidate division SR1 bacterium CG_4_9_14_3_um_filter_40_9]|nr:MAG: hypothetical protein CO170_01570 [candidate division SR1 bacterium CG_4_9_14_3_um_filter_40_9]
MKKELKKLVEKNKFLFWDCKTYGLDESAIVERFLNYAEMDQIRDLIKILGYDRMREIFKGQIVKTRLNYVEPAVVNLFISYFKLKNEIPYRDTIERAKKSAFFYQTI